MLATILIVAAALAAFAGIVVLIDHFVPGFADGVMDMLMLASLMDLVVGD